MVEKIYDLVFKYTKVEKEEIQSRERKRDLVVARTLFTYIAGRQFKMDRSSIANELGVDRSVINNYQAIIAEGKYGIQGFIDNLNDDRATDSPTKLQAISAQIMAGILANPSMTEYYMENVLIPKSIILAKELIEKTT